MEINYLSENIKLYNLSKAIKKTVFMEYEHVISDSRADVASVIKGNAHVTEDNVVLDNGLLKLKGKLKTVVCLKSVNGSLFSVQQVLDIDEKLDTFEGGDEITIASSCVVEKVECRIINERKIGVRVRFDVFVDCNGVKSVDVISGLEENQNAEVRTKELQVNRFAGNIDKNIEVSDTFLIPNDFPEVFELLDYEAVLKNVESVISEGTLLFKGDICFRLYYSCGSVGENIRYIENNVPFSETEDISDMRPTKMLCNVKPVNFSMDVAQDGDGEYRLINGSALVNVSAFCFEETTVETIEDLYGIDRMLTPETRRVAYTYPVHVSRSTCQTTETMNIGENSQIAEVIGMDANAYITEQTYDNSGVLSVKGDIPVTMVYKDANGEINSHHHVIPFKYDEKMLVNPNMSVKVWVEQTHAAYNLLSGNEPDVRVNVNLSFKVYGTDMLNYVEDIKESEYADENMRASLVLHYCSSDDTVWKLAKKFRIPQITLRQMNDLGEEDRLEEGRQIIIPL
jgi:hypothetical protein